MPGYHRIECDCCGELKEQIFFDLRYARPVDLDALDLDLMMIDKSPVNEEDAVDTEGTDSTYMKWLLSDEDVPYEGS